MTTAFRSSAGPVQAVLGAARRRSLFVLAVEQIAVGLGIVCAGAILVLLFGTQLLDWRWLTLVFISGACAVAFRLRGRLVDQYRLAQIIDSRLHLSDSLSTAWFLLSGPERSHTAAARYQIARAEELATKLDLSGALPSTANRHWRATGLLLSAAVVLFAIRYFALATLDLKPSLLPLHMAPGAELRPPEAKIRPQVRTPDTLRSLPTARAGEEENPAQAKAGRQASANSSVAESSRERSRTQDESQTGDSGGKSSASANQPDSRSDQSAAGDRKSSQETAGARQGGNSDEQRPGLFNRMKDALSAMMAKMQQNAGTAGQKGDTRNGSGDQKAQSATGQDRLSSSQNAKGQQGAAQDSSPGAQQQAEAVEKSQSGQGTGSSQSSPGKSDDPQSGAGRQDGAKDVREAEQLKTMGKLEEIIGKRSASLTGEMTIETPSGPQHLKTQYSNKLGHHMDSGGVIHRDEIPPEYRDSVLRYMDSVRQQAAAK